MEQAQCLFDLPAVMKPRGHNPHCAPDQSGDQMAKSRLCMCNLCTQGEEHLTRLENSIDRKVCVQVLRDGMCCGAGIGWLRATAQGAPAKGTLRQCAVPCRGDMARPSQIYFELEHERMPSPRIAKAAIKLLLSALSNQIATIDSLSTIRLFFGGRAGGGCGCDA